MSETAVRKTTWLVIVDVQLAFTQPASPWYVPGVEDVVPRIGALADAYHGRVICTKFVPPRLPEGSWGEYYGKWNFALDERLSHLWMLAGEWSAWPAIETHRLSKWGPELAKAIQPSRAISLCGVASDVCVLSTALAAIDDGVNVSVIEDACAAGTRAAHSRAMTLLRGRSPQICVRRTADELGSRARDGGGGV